MADSTVTQNLVVTFSHDGEVEHMSICPDGDKALSAASNMLWLQDALRAGDCLKIEWRPAPNLIEQALA
jgi:hypothetical protein